MSRPSEHGEGGVDPFAGIPAVDERICEWVDGCLSERERGRFEAELRVSPVLRRQLAEYEAAVADVRAALQEPTVEVSIADRVMAQVAVQAADAAASPSRRGAWRLVWTSAAAAAALALVVWIDGLAARPSRMQVAADSRVMEQASSAGVDVADPARSPVLPEAAVVTLGAKEGGPQAETDPPGDRGVALLESVEQAAPSQQAGAGKADGRQPGVAKAKRAGSKAGEAASGGRYGGRGGRISRGPATAGPTGPSPEAAASAKAVERAEPMALVTFAFDVGAAAKLSAWAAAAPAARPDGATPGSAAGREYEAAAARAWFAKEALRALAGSGAVASAAPALPGLRFVLEPAATGSPKALPEWRVVGPQESLQGLLSTLAAGAGAIDARVTRGEVAGRPQPKPRGDAPADDASAVEAPAQLLVRFGRKR